MAGDEIYEEGEDDSIDVNKEAEGEKGRGGGDEKVHLLDSLDEYLTLMDSLNSMLREGWFDQASARHSMGNLRINSTLLDLKFHPAASTLQVTEQEDVESLGSVPHFYLSIWASKGKGKDFSPNADSEMGSPRSPQLRHRGVLLCPPFYLSVCISHLLHAYVNIIQEKPSAMGETVLAIYEEVKREQDKSLSVFVGLVSPKLCGAQLSFETALETLVE